MEDKQIYNSGSLCFLGFYLYELGLSQEERDRLGMRPITDAEKEFIANAKKRAEELKTINKEQNEPSKSMRDDFVTFRVKRSEAAPGWGLKFERPVFPHVEIPRTDIMTNHTVAKTLGSLIHKRLDADMVEFGEKFGFPVIFVFYRVNHEDSDGCVRSVCTIELFTKDQMHEATRFARDHLGELGVFEPMEKYKQEFLQQPVLDGPLPKFCIAHHCTKRNKACAKCAYTAFSISHRRRLEGKA